MILNPNFSATSSIPSGIVAMWGGSERHTKWLESLRWNERHT